MTVEVQKCMSEFYISEDHEEALKAADARADELDAEGISVEIKPHTTGLNTACVEVSYPIA